MKMDPLWMTIIVLFFISNNHVLGNSVCISNLGQWSLPGDRPHISQSYTVGQGQECEGHPPLTLQPECWIGILPHPCQFPQAFDTIVKETCLTRQSVNPEVCQFVGYILRKGMCAQAPYRGLPPPVRLDCGNPLFWGWKRVTYINQLKPGWEGICLIRSIPEMDLEFGHTIKESKPRRKKGKRRTGRETNTLPYASNSSITTSLTRIRRKRILGEIVNHIQCQQCIHVTMTGNIITHTLVYHTSVPPTCTQFDLLDCTLNGTSYKQCNGSQGIQCYDPKQATRVTNYQVILRHKTCGRKEEITRLVTPTLNQQVTLKFDVCAIINRACFPRGGCGGLAWERTYTFNDKYMCLEKNGPRSAECQNIEFNYCPYWTCVAFATWIKGPTGPHQIALTKGTTNTNCNKGECNPVLLSLTPKSTFQPMVMGLQIDGKGTDPGTLLELEVTTKTTSIGRKKSLFWSYYQEIEKLNIQELPSKVVNTFVELAGNVANILNVSSCFVCGGTNMGEKWPWEAQELNYTTVLEMEKVGNLTATLGKDGNWALTSNLVGSVCYTRNHTTGCQQVGALRCLSTWNNGQWWSGKGQIPPWEAKALESVNLLKHYILDPQNYSKKWLAPDGMYWICGKYAYSQLPSNWCGSCVLGLIRPGFFLLPLRHRQVLGIPVYDEVGNIRTERAIDTSIIDNLKIGTWKDDEWPPERIIQVYGPATWAEDGTYGYRTPIYMLNRLIRLQAVIEIITNETVLGLTKLAVEGVKSRTYIMQNRLALDYLLAKEGGVCGKFNLSNCCVEIDDSGHVIQEITNKMVKIAHVPVQTWKGLNLKDIFGQWFPKLPGLQAIVALIGLIAAGCIILPCVLPILVKAITNSLSLLAERKATAQVMAMWEYEGLRQSPHQEPEYVTLLSSDSELQRGD